MIAAIVNMILLIPFLLLAFVFSQGKGAFLIAGYNTMSEDKKAQYDEVAMCKFMGKIMYGISFSIFLWGLSAMVDSPILFGIGMGLFFAFLIFAIVRMNSGDRFKKATDTTKE
ncbi:DUF3784 domain-containing protein [Sporosarcina sp. CAU 1771]